jgi:hypothetical protein
MTMIISLSFYVAIILSLAIAGLAGIRHKLGEVMGAFPPTAHAWNPNSHDKMTSYSMGLLQISEIPTLLGWVFQNCGKNGNTFTTRFTPSVFFCNNESRLNQTLINELRRGSIDEDMSSDIWRNRRVIFGIPYMAITGGDSEKSVLEKIRMGIEEITNIRNRLGYASNGPIPSHEWDKINQSFEGTNGLYHFYNPTIIGENRSGLSEPTETGNLVLKELQIECIKSVMPSALARATEERSGSNDWCLDKENRNYTINDAIKYFNIGYYHLAFYSVGRLLHLLQDMAVPAHVRNDSHGNMGDDNPEPLEYFADYMDHNEHIIPYRGDPIAYDYVNDENTSKPGPRWEYKRDSYYDSNDNMEQWTRARGNLKFLLEKKRFQKYEDMFKNLASLTHDSDYSFGTIPGNADSHRPDSVSDKDTWFVSSFEEEHFRRCRVNVDSLVDVFLLLYNEMEYIYGCYLADYSLLMESGQEPTPDWNYEGLTRAGFRSKEFVKFGSFSEMVEHFRSVMAYLPLDQIKELYKKWKIANNSTKISIIEDFEQRWSYLNIDDLTKYLGDDSVFLQDNEPNQNRIDAMKKWLLSHPDTIKLTSAFQKPPSDDLIFKPSPSRNFHKGFHGPFCLANDHDEVKPEKGLPDKPDFDEIIRKQWIDRESDAMGYSAYFLALWFESQFHPGKDGEVIRGIGIWQNQNSPKADELPPLLGELLPEVNENDSWEFCETSGLSAVTIGIVNHLPVSVDLNLDVSVSLQGSDGEKNLEDLPEFKDGLTLNVFCGQYINDWVKREKPQEGKPMREITKITIKDNPGKPVELIELTPYNAMTLSKFPLPVDNVSPFDASVPMGGIRRDLEEKRLIEVRCGPPVDEKMRKMDEEIGGHNVKPMEYAAILRLELAAQETR